MEALVAANPAADTRFYDLVTVRVLLRVKVVDALEEVV